MGTGKCEDIKKARGLLSTLAGNVIDICGELYDIIVQSDCSAEVCRFIYENYEMIESDESVDATVLFEEGEEEQYIGKYGKLVDGILEKTLKDQLPAQEFYAALWEAIKTDVLFEDKKAKVFALYYIWIDVRIPYFEVCGGIRMEKDEYQAMTRELAPYIQKARFICFSEYEQKTERSSLLLRILDEVEGEDKRAVLLAAILQIRDRVALSRVMRNVQRHSGEIGADSVD